MAVTPKRGFEILTASHAVTTFWTVWNTMVNIVDNLVTDDDSRLINARIPLDASVTDAKVATGAAIQQAKIAGLGSALNAKASLDGPTFTGQPKAGLPLVDTGLATKLYVDTLTAKTVEDTAYTLSLEDQGKVLETIETTPVSITVPPDSSVNFPVGTQIWWCRLGAGTGAITFVAGAGVTIRTPTTLISGPVNSSGHLRKRGANDWVLDGRTT